MNSCVLMAEIIKDPELRYTPDNQTAIAEMLVQFPGMRTEDPPTTLKVVGWGNIAQEIQEQYHLGDRIVIEGRLQMNTIERPEGFKEKRAELVVSKICSLTNNSYEAASASESTATSNTNNVVSLRPTTTGNVSNQKADHGMYEPETASLATETRPLKAVTPKKPEAGQDLDDIPF
ncbi:single-strand binding protein [Crinalium epipsammum PCC 9333]|uniref:Single-strand binding protein n=1 Tax=Crinalium epipsammum PCC 9333 TaxID=1173022 RepID=K9W335_9CYAN|nr:single-stranded DNA-binding protein [Crinalium epipsammum]AFZ14606.1 single-strand binding protein [Crinalium epipsammum PCC 9333]